MKKKIFILSVVLVVVSFAYYTISPFFRNIRLDEPAPIQMGEIIRSQVIGTVGHPASGYARIVESEGKRYLRYEEFKTINGPDIYVYLAKDMKASEFVNLGRVRATEGSVNYEIPEGIDIAEYPYALIWCQAFGVLFNSAKLGS